MPETSAAPPVIETVLPPKGWWARVYHWLFDLNNPKGHATALENSVGWLIILSVVAIIGEHNAVIDAEYGSLLHVFDVLSVAVFSFTVQRFGLIVAGPVSMMVAMLASPDIKWVEGIIFSVIMTAFCALLFKTALGLPIPVNNLW